MAAHQQTLLDALRFELSFLEHGGYDRSVREPRKELSVFRDSPSCLNYASAERTHPCSECLLINFVPDDKRGESVPCHHIPLNDLGDTLETLQGYGRDFDVQEAMRGWLRKKIADLQAAPASEAHQNCRVCL
jgi:hypothetical protein